MSDDAYSNDVAASSIRKIIRTVLGMSENSVRPANQFNSPPTGLTTDTFATVLCVSTEVQGRDSLSYEVIEDSNQITEAIQGLRKLDCSVQFFKAGAVDRANRLTALLQKPSSVALMTSLGIGFIRATKVMSVPVVIDTRWEERSQLNIEFYTVSRETSAVDSYGKFNFALDDGVRVITGEVDEP